MRFSHLSCRERKTILPTFCVSFQVYDYRHLAILQYELWWANFAQRWLVLVPIGSAVCVSNSSAHETVIPVLIRTV